GWQQLTMDLVGRSFRLNSLGLVLGPVSGVLAVLDSIASDETQDPRRPIDCLRSSSS
ncbi:hypothetical protein HK102_004469, partial [Quaeritorhiza haematococci]